MTSSEMDKSRYFMIRSTSRRGFWGRKIRWPKFIQLAYWCWRMVREFSLPLSCPHRRGKEYSSSLSPPSILSRGHTRNPMTLQKLHLFNTIDGNCTPRLKQAHGVCSSWLGAQDKKNISPQRQDYTQYLTSSTYALLAWTCGCSLRRAQVQAGSCSYNQSGSSSPGCLWHCVPRR